MPVVGRGVRARRVTPPVRRLHRSISSPASSSEESATVCSSLVGKTESDNKTVSDASECSAGDQCEVELVIDKDSLLPAGAQVDGIEYTHPRPRRVLGGTYSQKLTIRTDIFAKISKDKAFSRVEYLTDGHIQLPEADEDKQTVQVKGPESPHVLLAVGMLEAMCHTEKKPDQCWQWIRANKAILESRAKERCLTSPVKPKLFRSISTPVHPGKILQETFGQFDLHKESQKMNDLIHEDICYPLINSDPPSPQQIPSPRKPDPTSSYVKPASVVRKLNLTTNPVITSIPNPTITIATNRKNLSSPAAPIATTSLKTLTAAATKLATNGETATDSSAASSTVTSRHTENHKRWRDFVPEELLRSTSCEPAASSKDEKSNEFEMLASENRSSYEQAESATRDVAGLAVRLNQEHTISVGSGRVASYDNPVTDTGNNHSHHDSDSGCYGDNSHARNASCHSNNNNNSVGKDSGACNSAECYRNKMWESCKKDSNNDKNNGSGDTKSSSNTKEPESSASESAPISSIPCPTGWFRGCHGFRQPLNIVREPLGCVASRLEVAAAEEGQLRHQLAAYGRRRLFETTSRCKELRTNWKQQHNARIIELRSYSRDLLLRYSSSLQSQQPPAGWKNILATMPELAAQHPAFFNPDLYKQQFSQSAGRIKGCS